MIKHGDKTWFDPFATLALPRRTSRDQKVEITTQKTAGKKQKLRRKKNSWNKTSPSSPPPSLPPPSQKLRRNNKQPEKKTRKRGRRKISGNKTRRGPQIRGANKAFDVEILLTLWGGSVRFLLHRTALYDFAFYKTTPNRTEP